MNKKAILKKRLKIIALLTIFFAVNFYVTILTNNSNFSVLKNANTEENAINLPNNYHTAPELSVIGEHPWWSEDFKWRQLINVTNPYGINLYNFVANVTFNYTKLVNEGKMDDSLKDIRIVEYDSNRVGLLRKSVVWINYTAPEMATVWFEANCTKFTTDGDTYLYYGNLTTVSRADDTIGMVLNGDFEYTLEGDKAWRHPYNPLYWTWSHDLPDYILPYYSIPGESATYQEPYSLHPSPGPDYSNPYYFHNKLVNNTEKIGWVDVKGEWTYKWGSNDSYAYTSNLDDDYVGVFYSDLFRVPVVEQGATISLTLWRNIRTDSFDTNQDGYFLRLVNYTTATKSNPDAHQHIKYVEFFRGAGSAGTLVNYTGGVDGITVNTRNGELTGNLIINLNAYQGQTLALEMGMYGNEGGGDCAIGQIDNVHFNYNLTASLNSDSQMQKAEVRVIAKDVNGRAVPNAKVALVNYSAPVVDRVYREAQTSEKGSVLFTNVNYGVYNITINYTISTGQEGEFYNSFEEDRGILFPDTYHYNFTGLYYTYEIEINMTTIDFEIEDSNGVPLNFGYVNISDSQSGQVIEKLNLDQKGLATFRWYNKSKYYYKIYYDNADYKTSPLKLNESDIYISNYDKPLNRYFTKILDVNTTNSNSPLLPYFKVGEPIYTNGLSEFGSNKKFLKVNLTLSNMNDYLEYIDVYYLDENGTNKGLIYTNHSDDLQSKQDAFVEIDIYNTQVQNPNLINEAYHIYGLLIDVYGFNSTMCKGTIKIATIETFNIYNKTALSKIKIKVVDNENKDPVSDVIIHVNETLINLTTSSLLDTKGYAFGQINSDAEFWYLNGYNYSFELEFFGSPFRFHVNFTNPASWKPQNVLDFSYRLDQNSSLIFEIILDIEKFYTNFTFAEGAVSAVWGQNMTFQVNFSYTEDGEVGPWNPITNPKSIICSVKSWQTGLTVFSMSMFPGQGNGNYTATFNSSRLSAGIDSENYWVVITGKKEGYTDPIPQNFPIVVYALPTSIIIYRYSDLSQYQNNLVSQYYNELINITVQYNDTVHNTRLYGASLVYDWQFSLGPTVINPDPIHSGFYTFTINTADTNNVGTYPIEITAELENYTKFVNFGINLEVLIRPTSINGTTTLLHNSTSIWINDSFTIIYEYYDTLEPVIVGNLDEYYYYWYKVDEEGKPIGKASVNINLANMSDNRFLLDFKTENREPGDYAIFVTLKKNNFEARNAFIDLTIEYRVFTVSLTATGKEGLIITRVKGQPIVISLRLTDPTKSSSASSGGTVSTQAAASLTGAIVKLSIEGLGKTYKFKELKSGIYNLTIETTDPAYQAFFTPQTLSANITIEKENYVTQKIDITIVIDMEQWPIPGFPAFYFLIIVIGLGAVVGSLATYRYIQLTQIPTFLKKARAMKKAIKGSELISESLLYPSKEEFTVKKYGDKWEFLGISLESVLGIERKKMEMTPEIKEMPKPSLGKRMRNLYDNIKEKVKKIEFKKKKDDLKGGEA